MHLISFILKIINYLNHLSSNMESTWLVLLFSCIAALAYLSKLFLIKRSSHWNPPPGPKPWPIIGNLHQLGSIPHQSLHKLAQKYGDIMFLKVGSRPVVVASSPKIAKEILRTHDTTFASRPEIAAAGKYTSYNNVNILWAPYGPYWRQARKIFAEELLNPKRLDAFEYIRVEERKVLITRLFALSGKPITLKEHLLRYTLSSMGRMVLSDKYFIEKLSNNSVVSLEALNNMIAEWIYINGVLNLGDWIPWLGFLDLQGHVKQMKKLNKKLDRFHNVVLADHKAKSKANNSDMVDVLLQRAEDPNLEIKLTTDCIKGLVQDLLAGGTESSATTVEWAFNELLKHPQVLEKATEELDRVIGKERWVEETDFKKLPYIEGILRETFRLHPAGTLLAPHYSTQDCNVAGYDIAKGTIVWVNIWSIGRDPKNWESPEEFNPQRFMEKEINIRGQNFNLLPFGSGRRSCPGYSLGTKIVRSSLANLIHGFNWKLPENMKPKDVCMEERFGLSTNPKFPLHVIVKPRLPSHLYY